MNALWIVLNDETWNLLGDWKTKEEILQRQKFNNWSFHLVITWS